jgi:hypothetical protein
MYRGYLSQKYVLKYHYIDDAGKVSKDPSFPRKGLSIKWEKRVILGMRFSKPQRVSWPIVSYHLVKTVFTKKKDFQITKTGKLIQNMELDPTNAIIISAALEEAKNPIQTDYQTIKVAREKMIAPRLERNQDFLEEYEILKNIDL